jgi:translation initiation factor 5
LNFFFNLDPTKYFGCELGAQVSINNDLYVVNGCHDPEKLQKLLYGFIDKFVLCNKCNNPETNLTITNNKIGQKCIACGHDTTINKSLHKITTYIINHPPEGAGNTLSATAASATNSSGSGSKREKGSKGKKKDGSKSPDNGEGKKQSEASQQAHRNRDG